MELKITIYGGVNRKHQLIGLEEKHFLKLKDAFVHPNFGAVDTSRVGEMMTVSLKCNGMSQVEHVLRVVEKAIGNSYVAVLKSI